MKGLYIDGNWLCEQNQPFFEIVNPATEERVSYCASATVDQVQFAVHSAETAFINWKNTPAPERATFLWKAADVFKERQTEIANMITQEMGKVIAEARGEVGVVIETCKYMAGEGRRLFGQSVPSGMPNRHIQLVRNPIGVVACITPWNFPIALAGYKILAALVCGNTVVWKPASEVPLTAQLFTEVFEEIGLPRGVLNLITGPGRTVGEQLINHGDVKLISFTGSTDVGKKIAIAAGPDLKRVSLELGGKNAAIVLDDADLELAADQIVKSAFGTTGQKCTATSRVIALADIHDHLLKMVVDKTKRLKVGNGSQSGVDLGPLVSHAQRGTVEKYVAKGLEDGATLECGGKRTNHVNGFFYEPTIFSNVGETDSIAREEIFGPILSFSKVSSFEEAIELNNQTEYGLSTSLFTNSLHLANRGAREIDTGLVYINIGTANAEIGVPFGGMKQSGNGHREVSHHSFDFMSEWKSIYTSF